MSKKYKTVSNLKKVWTHIDNALSELNLAFEISQNDDELKAILERFDETQLTAIKQEIEELLESKTNRLTRV